MFHGFQLMKEGSGSDRSSKEGLEVQVQDCKGLEFGMRGTCNSPLMTILARRCRGSCLGFRDDGLSFMVYG